MNLPAPSSRITSLVVDSSVFADFNLARRIVRRTDSGAAFLARAGIRSTDQVRAGRLADRPIDSAAAIGFGGALDFGLFCLLYIPLYTACVFCACCPGPLRRRESIAQVQGRVGFPDFGDMLYSWDKVGHSGNISKALVLLRAGFGAEPMKDWPVPKTGASLARARAAIDRRSAASRATWVFVI